LHKGVKVKKSFIVVGLCFSLACNNQKKLNSSNDAGKQYSLIFSFSENAKKKYDSSTTIQLNNIHLSGLPDVIEKKIKVLTADRGIESGIVQIVHEQVMRVIHLMKNGSGEIETLNSKMQVKKLHINGKKILFTPYKLPGSQNKPMKLHYSKKGELLYFGGKNELQKQMGLLREKVFQELLETINNSQKFPDKKIAIGESWDSTVNKNISLKTIFSPQLTGDGNFSIKTAVKNKLKSVKNNFFEFESQFSGTISVNVTSQYGNGEFLIDIDGKGELVLDNNVGLIESSKIKSNFSLAGEINPQKAFVPQFGNPEIEMKGIIQYTLGPQTIKQ